MKLIGVFLLLCLSHIGYGQGTGVTLHKIFPLQAAAKTMVGPYTLIRAWPFQSVTQTKPLYTFKSPYRHVDELGFFCKVELKWDKKLSRPFRFRLGSYDYVNKLEGK